MAHHIDWDNIHLHIHDNDVRYKRRLRRKRLFINCSPDNTSLKKLKSVKDQNFMGNDELMVACPNVVTSPKPIRVNFGGKRNDRDPDLEVFKEGFTESLVYEVEDDDLGDGRLKKLKSVKDQNFMGNDDLMVAWPNVVTSPKPISVNLRGKRNDGDPDLEVFKEGFTESLVCEVEDDDFGDGGLKELKSFKDQNFMGNDELRVACLNVVTSPKPISVNLGGKRNDGDPDLEVFKEGFRESLVCEVEDGDFGDGGLKNLENVRDRKFLCDDDFWVECSNVVLAPDPIRVKCGTRGDVVDFDSKMFDEGLKEGTRLNAASDVGIEEVEHVQDRDLGRDEIRVNCRGVEFGRRRMILDPDYKKYLECLKEDGDSFSAKVVKNDGSLEFLKYERDELRDECQRKKGDRVKNVERKQKGGTAKELRKNKRKEKRDKVVPGGDVSFVSTKEKGNVMPRREAFSGNSNRYTLTKRSSVVKSGDYKEIISIGKPSEIEEVTISKNYRPSKTIQNKGPLNLEDGRDIKNLRKSKKKYEKVERRPCLTRIDHESNLMDTAGEKKRHLAIMSRERADYQKTSPRNKRREPVVQQGDIENLRFSSDIGNVDVMVKEEKFDGSANTVLSKNRRQMIQGKDSVYDNNLRTRYKCDTKFVKYAEVKVENANSLNNYEEENEHSSDLEILDMNNQQNLSTFEVMKVFNASVIEDNPLSMVSPSDYETSQFREELMDILRRPYSLVEYRTLMQRAKYRHLNGGPEYSDGLKGKKVSNTYGKSPLDYHPEVKRRLRQCRRITKRLNIVRGFMYWYERTCQEGAFKPWLDKSCCAITPSYR